MYRFKTLLLSDETPFARGGSRYVYRHPEDPGLVIKTPRWDRQPKRYRLPHWYRQGRLRPTLRQIEEFLTVAASSPQYLHLMERFYGFVETDIGPGLIFEALYDESGRPAPTLAQLIQRGDLNVKIRVDLESFLRELLKSGIILDKDFHANNLVYARRGDADTFVLVDSIGDRSPLALSALHPAIRNWRVRHMIARLMRSIDIRAARHSDTAAK